MSDRLNVLAENCNNILLAEIGAMIHNIGKMSEEHLKQGKFQLHLYFGDFLYDLIQTQTGNINGLDTNNINNAQGKFYSQPLKTLLTNLKISFPTAPLNDREYELREFSYLRIKQLYENKILDNLLGGKTSLLGKLLSEAHGRAVGGDKGFTLETNTNQQDKNAIHLSTAFGYEVENISSRNISSDQKKFLDELQKILQEINDFIGNNKQREVNTAVNKWKELYTRFQHILKKHISPYIADTRHPIDDIDLYSFHHSTASFFKAGIAKILLENPGTLTYADIEKFEWKLLSVRYNGLDYLLAARGINDILGKQSALETALNKIKQLLEVEYPIANEIYRDENGSVFLFPTLERNIEKEILKEVVEKIENIFKEELQRDLKPHINFSESSRQALKLGPVISEFTPEFNQFYPDISPGHSKITINGKAIQVDLCQSCHLRFIGTGLSGIILEKAVARKICGVCYERRDNRAKNWWENEKNETIWIDEVADEHGQIALIAGKFNLNNWLNGFFLNSFLNKTYREIFEKKPSLFTSFKNKLKREIQSNINRTFQRQANNSLRQEISNTIQQINDVIDSCTQVNINNIYQKIKQEIENLKNRFLSSGVNISYNDVAFNIFKFFKNSITKSFPDSLSPFLSFNPNNAFTNLNEFDDFLKNDRDVWGIFQNNDEHRLLFLNAKPASFARIDRIWHQTREFNLKIPLHIETCMDSIKRNRLYIKAIDESSVPAYQKSFKSTHVYEFKEGNVSFSLYCVKGSEDGNRELEFVSATNWQYLKKQFHFKWQKKLTKGTLLKETQEKLSARIESIEMADQSYYPYVTILAQPQLFMFWRLHLRPSILFRRLNGTTTNSSPKSKIVFR